MTAAQGKQTYEIDNLVVRRNADDGGFQLSATQFKVDRGERWALVGPSGCGKSTLLDALAMISTPASVGRFIIWPQDGMATNVRPLLTERRHSALARLRARFAGYVLQTGGLMPFLNVQENIELPCRLNGQIPGARAAVLAERLGIARHLKKKPQELSVGERQRVAIARALAHRPVVVLADEPTAALDPATADGVMSLLVDLAEREGAAVIVASHDIDRIDRFGFSKAARTMWKDKETGCAHTVFST